MPPPSCEKEFGSVEKGKSADLVVLGVSVRVIREKNPKSSA
jgi:imidazolonepropionase-like amidohydrolase